MSDDRQNKDLFLNKILPYAAIAPSPLNTKPWKFSYLISSRVEIFMESTRVLLNLDPQYRQVMISMGALLENLDLSARQAGFIADVVYFPSGWPEPKLDPEAPVARIDLLPDDKVIGNPHFGQIINRRSDRSVFKRREIDSGKFDVLSCSFDPGPAPVSFGYTTNCDLKKELAAYLIKAMEIELNDETRFSEILTWMRLSSVYDSGHQTGLNLDELGLSHVSCLYAHLMMSLLSNPGKDRFIKHTLLKLCRKQAHSAAAFGWITSRENHRISQIRAGRVFERIHLAAIALGLSLQPMTQIIRDYEDMKDLRKPFYELLGIPETHTVQMFFRLGYSGHKPTPHHISDYHHLC